ncbi:MAG: adenylate/guanylate cyclase domain-containing protein [Synechococcaceae cyanobacterium SM2_3_60]|nr:adenylate/guanylate cyclase domain-containing protein [Synechococcaceae cyanobacterium SM2_3_60]
MTHPLLNLEPRLRYFLPATLYATMWVTPHPEHLQTVFEHLRTLHRNLCDYVPNPIQKGWQEGTLMFSDLAGFTRLSEANAAQGQASLLAQILNTYFTTMLDIATNFGGEVLEFAGDSLLVQFRGTRRRDDSVRAAQAGLLMQAAMASFQTIYVGEQCYPLAMRIGIHRGCYLSTVLGSPRRQQRVILGALGQVTKQAESLGEVGRVCITEAIASQLPANLAYVPHSGQHYLLTPTAASLPSYAPTLSSRPGNLILLDRSEAGLIEAISKALDSIEPIGRAFYPRLFLSCWWRMPARSRLTFRWPRFCLSISVTLKYPTTTPAPSL